MIDNKRGYDTGDASYGDSLDYKPPAPRERTLGERLLDDANEALDDFESSLVELHRENTQGPDDWADLAVGLHEFKRRVGDIYALVEADVVDAIGDGYQGIVRGRTVKVREGASRKAWDHIGLRDTVSKRIEAIAVDFDTGERLLTPRELLNRAWDCIGLSYWKVGELKGLGVSADDYCEVTAGKKSLDIRGG